MSATARRERQLHLRVWPDGSAGYAGLPGDHGLLDRWAESAEPAGAVRNEPVGCGTGSGDDVWGVGRKRDGGDLVQLSDRRRYGTDDLRAVHGRQECVVG